MNFRNYLLAAISAPDLAILGPHLTEVALSLNHTLHHPGDPVTHVYFPSSAVISIVTPLLDGRSVESATVGYENDVGLIGALSGEPASARAFAQVPGSAIRLPSAKVQERAIESPRFMTLLMRHLNASTSQAQQSVACNALHDATSRLARWLLMTADRIGSAQLPLTQEYLAIMLGVQRTTVTSVAGILKNAGLIGYRRGLIQLLDREGLEALACECYAVLKSTSDRLLTGKTTADGPDVAV